jgi:DNA-binding beta-propeller fold protein YncE
MIDAVGRIVWSGGGSYALLYSSSRNQLQRIRVSETEVAADPPLDISPFGQGQVTSLAIDPAGRQMAFGIAGAGVYLWGEGQAPGLLSSMKQPAALTFDETGNRLYAADLDQQQVLEFDSGGAGNPVASLAQADGPPLTPAGMAVSRGARYLLLADTTTKAVLVYETGTYSLVNSIPLDFVPSRMEALSTNSSYLLNGDNSQEWLLVLDASQTPAVYFVPARAKEAQ